MVSFKKLLSSAVLCSAFIGTAFAEDDSDRWYFHTSGSGTDKNVMYSPYGYSIKRFTYKAEIGNKDFAIGLMGAHYNIYGYGSKNFKDPYIIKRFHNEINDKWSAHYGFQLGLPFENHYHFRRSYDFIGVAHFDYRIDDEFTVKFGALTHLAFVLKEIFPVAGIYYRNEKDNGLSFKFGYPEMSLYYRFNDVWSIQSELNIYKYTAPFDNTVFSVYVPQLKTTYSQRAFFVIDDSMILSQSVICQPANDFRIKLQAGLDFHHRMKFYDEDGSQLASLHMDNGFFAFASFDYYF